MSFSKEAYLVVFVILVFNAFAFSQVSRLTAPQDAQITEILKTVNGAEIEAAQLASKSTNKVVRDFAKHMILAHEGSNKEITSLEKDNKMSDRNSQTSEKLKIDTGNQFATLKKLSGTELDRTYITDQVKDHSDVLEMIDKTLIPNAKNRELKSLLTKTRDAVASHLDMAKKVQSEL